jgi:1,4-dihydroxy-2-naphthoyl-CoA hydrolase
MGSSDHDGSELDTAQARAIAAAIARRGWVEVLGLEFTSVTREAVAAVWDIDGRHLQPHGIVHGGVYASVVETCCSVGATLLAAPDKIIVGVENHTSFLRPVSKGRLTARATPLHAGRRAQLWECNISDVQARLIATGRLRVMCVDAETENTRAR